MELGKKVGLLGVLLVLLGCASLYLWFHGKPSAEHTRPFAKVDISKVDRIVVQNSMGAVTLTKNQEKWELSEPISDVANPTWPKEITEGFKNFSLGSIISENASKHSQFQVDKNQGSFVQVFIQGQSKPTFSGYVGKSAQSYDSCYFRFENSTPVYVANGLSEYMFRRDAKSYRLTQILPIADAEISQIRIIQDKSTVTLVHSSATWTLQSTNKSLEAGLVQPLINKLRELNATDFGTGAEAPDSLGFEKPFVRIELDSPSGKANAVIGKKSPAPYPKAPEMRYAQSEGRKAVLIVRDDAIQDLLNTLKPLH